MSTPPAAMRGLQASRDPHDGLISSSFFKAILPAIDNGKKVNIRYTEENMEQLLSHRHTSSHSLQSLDLGSCPFFNPGAALCLAALTPRRPPREILASACGCQDYEDCTTFLVRLLNRPGR